MKYKELPSGRDACISEAVSEYANVYNINISYIFM